jgi:hypothetical protein
MFEQHAPGEGAKIGFGTKSFSDSQRMKILEQGTRQNIDGPNRGGRGEQNCKEVREALFFHLRVKALMDAVEKDGSGDGQRQQPDEQLQPASAKPKLPYKNWAEQKQVAKQEIRQQSDVFGGFAE